MNNSETTAVAAPGGNYGKMSEWLADPRLTGHLEAVLPNIGITPERLAALLLTCCRENPKLLECDRRSVVGCMIKGTSLGLEIGSHLGQAWPVPFFNKRSGCMEAQLVVGYKGLMALAYRSGKVGLLDWGCVYDGEHFEIHKGSNPRLIHTPELDPQGQPIAYYATGTLRDGGTAFAVLSRRQVDEIRSRSQGKNSEAWRDNFDEMAKKSCMRRVCKLLPANAALAEAVALDERAEAGLSQNNASIIDLELPQVHFAGDPQPEPDQVPTSTSERVAQQIENQQRAQTEGGAA